MSGCCRTFQSTLPARGATAQATPPAIAQAHFNPRSPHGERPTWGAKKYASEDISIHAPRTGSDLGSKLLQVQINISIHAPRTGSDTDGSFVEAVTLGISIHAPRTGSDDRASAFGTTFSDFNPRSPHGERPPKHERGIITMKFQSTLPARGATPEVIDQLEKLYISIHAPRTGSDGNAATADATRRTFQSTLPARGATAGVRQSSRRACDFNPRSPHGERRHGGANRERGKTIFQSTLPARGATTRK